MSAPLRSGRHAGTSSSLIGIAMAGWDCNDLTTLSLDHVAFMDAVVELIERQDGDTAGPHHVALTCSVRWGVTA